MTSIGKYRHLSRVTTDAGHFAVMAIDHRTNLLERLNQHAPQPYTDAAFTAFKQQVIGALAPHASAVLVDPAYGIAAGVFGRNIPGKSGLLAPVEVTDYGLHPSQRELDFIPGWSVAKIKRVGGDGVKLLLPYHPEAANTSDKHAAVQQIIADCAAHDIPFFLEPIPYSPDPARRLSNAERLQISVEMCQTFTQMGVDVLKLPFPVDAAQSTDADEWRAACEQVNAACGVPWALLSAGVDFDTFLRQAEAACKAGASGVIAGRAVWGETTEKAAGTRAQFLTETATQRMQQLGAVCARYASAWHKHIPIPEISPAWYETYTP